MPITPLVPGYRLQIFYKTDLNHVMNYFVGATLVGSSYLLQDLYFNNIITTTFVSYIVGLMKPMMDSSSSFLSWTLEQYNSGAWVQVDTGTIGVAGTNAASVPTPGNQFSWTWFDLDLKHLKFRWLGFTFASVGTFKIPLGSVTGAYAAFYNDVIDITPGHLGAMLRGRSGSQILRGLNLVISYNRKSRRRLGDV